MDQVHLTQFVICSVRRGNARRTDHAQNQSRPTYSHSEGLHKYNSLTDDIRNITSWRCIDKVYASFTCNFPSSSKKFTNSSSKKYITPLSGFKQFSKHSFSHSRNTANASNSLPRGATNSTSVNSQSRSNRTATTRPQERTKNE
ncbi:hypothetical protein AVEN_109796-1 [Araneus ventricosus]|uniref:Uncharacterized protein n=1 Tax=Araneus ventricosus TaxID=182803 RepID=A0A4Y2KGT9_ARAVE|nr:hypothetical protein AVEN_109796-1 [Araneus ventricosus]